MKKILIPVIIIILIVVGILVVYFVNKTDNQNINIEPLTNAGASDLSCDVNADCVDICDKSNKCLIPSCTKNPTKVRGTCTCLAEC
ncbi:MAG: hypothetical protein ACNFW9_01995 [Candidatus Kerfeldbacteria bacterium]|jgi:hypothetical protein